MDRIGKRRVWLGLAAVAGFALASPAFAADDAKAKKGGDEVVEGQVTHKDEANKRVTVKSSDGKEHVFEASPETMKDLKPGDRIEAKKRPNQ